jgi:hypothetical protein
MKALDIDPYGKIIQEVDASERLETLRKGYDLGIFEKATFNHGGEQYIIYFDDSYLTWFDVEVSELNCGFYFRPCSRLIIGFGMIFCSDEDGSPTNLGLAARDLGTMVIWAQLSPVEAAK